MEHELSSRYIGGTTLNVLLMWDDITDQLSVDLIDHSTVPPYFDRIPVPERHLAQDVFKHPFSYLADMAIGPVEDDNLGMGV